MIQIQVNIHIFKAFGIYHAKALFAQYLPDVSWGMNESQATLVCWLLISRHLLWQWKQIWNQLHLGRIKHCLLALAQWRLPGDSGQMPAHWLVNVKLSTATISRSSDYNKARWAVSAELKQEDCTPHTFDLALLSPHCIYSQQQHITWNRLNSPSRIWSGHECSWRAGVAKTLREKYSFWWLRILFHDMVIGCIQYFISVLRERNCFFR